MADDIITFGDLQPAISLAGTEIVPIAILNPDGSVTTERTTTQGIANLAAASAGNVIGPGSSVSGDIAVFSGTTGKLITDTGVSAASIVINTRAVNTGTGLSGGGNLSADRTISLANTAVSPGSYGDATHVPAITIDAQGRITAASSIGIGGGTVTAVSVVLTNGFAGTSSGGATPALTLSTTVSGLVKGNGTALSAASAGTDYQAPVSLTTTGSSGVATFIGNVLNIPNYAPTAAQIQTALASLPTTLPGSAGQLWWNGGVLSLS